MRKPPRARATRAKIVAVWSLLLALTAASGCSFKLMKRPPPPSEWPTGERPAVEAELCTRTLAPPLLDTVVTLVLLGAAVYETRWADNTPALLLAAGAVPVGISAGYGYGVAVQCRRYNRRFAPP